MACGTLYAVGVGPGDPELITVKGLRRLQSVPVIVVPHKDPASSVGPGQTHESQAYRIARAYIDPSRQNILFIPLPMTKDVEKLTIAWEEVLKTLVPILEAGQDMAYILVGDPFLYGTFIHLFERLRSRYPHIPIEIIPGVSSIQAAAARARSPLAVAAERVAILPATYEAGERPGGKGGGKFSLSPFLRQALEQFETVVLMKVSQVFEEVLDLLEALDLVENTVYVEKVGFPEERIVRDIRTLRGLKLHYLSLLIVKNNMDRINRIF